MLIDLGYLEKAFKTNALNQNDIAIALSAFREELKLSGIFSQSVLNEFVKVYGKSADHKILERLTDIDEGVKFDSLPAFGDRDLKTRILHFRLNLLGLYEGFVAAPWSALSFTALENAALYAGHFKLRTVNLLADIESYTAQVLKKVGFKNPLVVFESAENNEVSEYKGSFKRQLKRDLDKHDAVFEHLDDALFFRRDKKVNLRFLEQLKNSDVNRFLLRLIQVHQWMAGSYNGVLDGDIGKITMESLLEVISQYNNEDRKDVKTDKILVRITGNTYLFNAVHFLVKYSQEFQTEDRTLASLQVISESIKSANAEDQQQFEANFQAEIENIKAGEKQVPENRNGFLPRIFTGIKTFFKKIFRLAKKLFKWIVEQAKKAIQFVRNVIRMIYGVLKEAVIHFINGVKFLLGKLPINTIQSRSAGMSTQFDLDKDAVNVVFGSDGSLFQQHIKNVNQTVGSMQFSLAFIIFLFKTLKSAFLATVPIAWPLFVLKMVYSFNHVIKQYQLINN